MQKKKLCLEKGCYKIPNFNFYNETKSLYCAKHKKENMINVTTKRCFEEGCDKK